LTAKEGKSAVEERAPGFAHKMRIRFDSKMGAGQKQALERQDMGNDAKNSFDAISNCFTYRSIGPGEG